MHNFGLYIVMTNPLLGYHAFTQICVELKVPMLQLRDKSLNDSDLLKLARSLKQITKDSKTRLIINDRVDICELSDADGLHLGPEDLPWQDARKIMTEGRIIGVSTHSLQEAQRLIIEVAEAPEGYRPDYMSFGPIFPTVAKAKPDPPVGTELLQRVIGQAPIPLVAIGGIFPQNQSQVLSTGAKNLCMIRHFGESSSANELITKIQLFNQDLKEL